MLKLLLLKFGAQVDLAEDGLEAVELVLADPTKYDIVFMDNLMPKMVRKIIINNVSNYDKYG